MIAHRWWEHYGRTPPGDPPPRLATYTGLPFGIDPVRANFSRAYYWTVGGILSLGPRMPVHLDLYLMRVLSAAFAAILLSVAWLGTREALGDTHAAVVTLLLALHPQFAVTATSANPDMFIDLAGACVWWQAMVGLCRNRVSALGFVWVAAAAAAFVDRMGVPLLIVALVATMFVLIRRAGLQLRTVLLSAAASAAIGTTLWFIDATWRVFSVGAMGYQFDVVPTARTWDFFVRFTSFLAESWWLALGWVRYAPPAWWVAVAFLLSSVAIAGVLWRLARDGASRARVVVALALAVVGIQLAAEYWTFYRVATGPQGRHLFPVLVPTLVLMWMGIERVVPPSHRRQAAIGLVLTFALLDSLAWIVVAIPAYAG
jgi:hypothetical protein